MEVHGVHAIPTSVQSWDAMLARIETAILPP